MQLFLHKYNMLLKILIESFFKSFKNNNKLKTKKNLIFHLLNNILFFKLLVDILFFINTIIVNKVKERL